jgi:hypothetical protein
MADGTQFVIELAAKFAGGDTAVATLATLGDQMLKAGSSAAELEEAAKQAALALEQSANATKLASDTLAIAEKRYSAAETAADRAGKSVEQFGLRAEQMKGKLAAAVEAGNEGKIARYGSALDKINTKQGEAVTKAAAAERALKREAAAFDAVKAKATEAAGKQEGFKKGLASLKGAADQAGKMEAAAKGTGKLGDIAAAFGKLGGPVGAAGQEVLGLGGAFGKLGSAMGSGGPYVAVALAIVAIASAAVLATIAITKWGVSMAEANRTQSMLAQGVAKSVEGGEQLNSKIGELSKRVPQSREELLGMAGDLAKTGLKGQELTDALESAAVKAATVKFGPDFEKQMLSSEVQSRRLGENLQETFGGLKIEGLLGGLSKLGALLDSSTSSGKVLKFLFETLFQPVIDAVTEAMPLIERLFLHAEILALKAFIALKPYHSQIKAIGSAFVEAAAIIGVLFGAAIAIAVAAVVGATAALGALLFAILHPIDAFEALMEAVKKLGPILGEALLDVGKWMIEGLVNGISAGASLVADALSSVVTGAVDGVAKFLQLGSPSKLLFGYGSDTAEGYAGGVDSGAADAQGALEAMVAPPTVPAPGAPGATAGGGLSLSIGQIIVSGESAKEQALDFIEQITQWLESSSITVGGGEVPAHA